MSEDAQEQTEVDPVTAIEQVIGRLDPNALVTGFVLISEWLEPDGSRTLLKLGTDMAPWHQRGLLEYAQHIDGWVQHGACTCGDDED